MNNVNFRIFPDKTFGYIVEAYTDKKSIPITTMSTDIEKAFAVIETPSYENLVKVFFED
jgi:hypothetical protein